MVKGEGVEYIELRQKAAFYIIVLCFTQNFPQQFSAVLPHSPKHHEVAPGENSDW